MCGRFTYLFTWAQIHDHLQNFIDLIEVAAGDPAAAHPDRYNIAPTQPILGIRPVPRGNAPALFRWGLTPVWVKDPRDFPLLINARIETAATKPAFRGSVKNLRVLIPTSGYYEWKSGADGKKQPYYITMEDGGPMIFAGLYATWHGPEGEEIDTAAIVTQAATGQLAEIHDRTPAVLRPEQYALWLDAKRVDGKEALAMIEPLENLGIVDFPVSTRVGSIKNDDPELIKPVGDVQPVPPAPARKKKVGGGQGELF